jgi:tetratricopeptide (TPR) repeat protein
MVSDTKKEKFALAKNYYLSNNFSGALALFKDLDIDDSNNPEIKLLLGITLLRSERYLDSIDVLNEVIKIQPNLQLANHALGSALFMIEDYQGSLSAFNHEININPNYPDAYCDKGYALNELGYHEEAFQAGTTAISLDPNYADGYNCISVALNHLYDLKQARDFAIKAINLDSSKHNYFYNLASIEKDLGEQERSIQLYHKAITIKPNYREALFSLSLIYLAQHNFQEGWNLYEARFDQKGIEYKRARDRFNLDNVPNKNILLRVEQGIGDQILFGSLFHELEDLNKNYIFNIELDKRLLKIFKRSFKYLNFLEPHSQLDVNFLECNLGSIGAVLRKNTESFKKQKNFFLNADKHKTEIIREKILKDTQGYKICGISWSSKNSKIGKDKSIELEKLVDILKTPKLIFINLQYDENTNELVSFCNFYGVEILIFDDIDLFNDIDSLFSLVDACDFIVTTSNINAHIAGSLGVRTFLLAPFSRGRHWYWQDGLKQSLWYPSIEIFNQSKDRDWSGAIKVVHLKILKEIMV